ncbi:sensor histidine kinase [Paenibacillus thalictri]|uniref:Sensor histidine kinase n=1 Tax=Paenibacillus thalictri TaxID=2527873 RepID=A0A4Q9DQM3_9BACL|nr:sensor histidine kinase [Paenibacillus thalictri]TBL76616.1 sensor histidine kinase [Paenibacillus thalictri]
MYKIIDWLRLNRTRTQILAGFLLVLAAVLSTAGGFLYKATTAIFIQTTEENLEETAKQAGARVDAVLSQIDTISLQAVTDPRIQSLLYRSKQGHLIPIDQKLSVRPILDQLVAFSWIVKSIDLYAVNEPFYPLENKKWSDLAGNDPQTLEQIKSGQLTFIGTHPDDSNVLLAVRQVRLEQDHLAGGGYVVIKSMKSMLDFFNEEYTSISGSSMHLYDQNHLLIASTEPLLPEYANLNVASRTDDQGMYPVITINGSNYLHIIKQTRQFGWSIHILVPLSTITGKLDVLKQILWFALAVGLLISLALLWPLSSMITLPIRKLWRKMRGVHFTLPTPNEVTYFNYEMNELNGAYNKLTRELHHLVETVYEKEKLKNQAEIKMLQAQIHPHFLFNTLESLYWTLIDREQQEAAHLVVSLSRLFRYTIKTSGGDDWIKLQEEIEHCRRYLEIMQFRLAHRLVWDIRMDPELGEISIPKLLIQPLVENAIQYGIEPKVSGGRVIVTVCLSELNGKPALNIKVQDNGDRMTADQAAHIAQNLEQYRPLQTSGSGIGLMNVQARIRLHYGEPYGVYFARSENAGTEVDLFLPL